MVLSPFVPRVLKGGEGMTCKFSENFVGVGYFMFQFNVE